MGNHVIDPDLEQELRTAAESAECELLHVEFAGNRLQIFLDREDGGVTIDHCQTVSRLVSAILDVQDFGKKKYVLEVSSPGLDRELYGPRDYRRFRGSLARVTFFDAERAKKTIIGRLGALEETTGDGRVTFTEEPSGQEWVIDLRDIQKARLEIEL